MSQVRRDLWIVVGMILSHTFLTALVVLSLLFACWNYSAESNPQVNDALEEFKRYFESSSEFQFSADRPLPEDELFIVTLLENTPWGMVAVLGSVIIFPFLGWWSGRLLTHPELGGLILLFTLMARQNIVLIPKNIEYSNLASVALSLPSVLAIVFFQFLLFTGALVVQQITSASPETNRSEDNTDELQ